MSYAIKHNQPYPVGGYYHSSHKDKAGYRQDNYCKHVYFAETFKCKSQAKRVAIQLGLSYDTVVEIDSGEDKL